VRREIRNPKAEIRKKAEGRRPNHGRPASSRISVFGFLISDFFRPSPFGFRISCLVFSSCAALIFAAEPNGASDLPPSSLKPPRAEIPPTVWEQHGPVIVVGAIVVLGALATGVWLFLRPKPVVAVPCAVQARTELEGLRDRPEDGALLSRTSQVLRHYFMAAFHLAAAELTTSEFCRAMASREDIGPELYGQVEELLRACDLRKFAATSPPEPIKAVDRSLAIINRAEKRIAQQQQSAAGVANSNASGHEPPGPQEPKRVV